MAALQDLVAKLRARRGGPMPRPDIEPLTDEEISQPVGEMNQRQSRRPDNEATRPDFRPSTDVPPGHGDVHSADADLDREQSDIQESIRSNQAPGVPVFSKSAAKIGQQVPARYVQKSPDDMTSDEKARMFGFVSPGDVAKAQGLVDQPHVMAKVVEHPQVQSATGGGRVATKKLQSGGYHQSEPVERTSAQDAVSEMMGARKPLAQNEAGQRADAATLLAQRKAAPAQDDELQAAQDSARRQRGMAQFHAGIDTISEAFSPRVKRDPNELKQDLELANQPVADLLQRRKSHAEQAATQQAQADRQHALDREGVTDARYASEHEYAHGRDTATDAQKAAAAAELSRHQKEMEKIGWYSATHKPAPKGVNSENLTRGEQIDANKAETEAAAIAEEERNLQTLEDAVNNPDNGDIPGAGFFDSGALGSAGRDMGNAGGVLGTIGHVLSAPIRAADPSTMVIPGAPTAEHNRRNIAVQQAKQRLNAGYVKRISGATAGEAEHARLTQARGLGEGQNETQFKAGVPAIRRDVDAAKAALEKKYGPKVWEAIKNRHPRQPGSK